MSHSCLQHFRGDVQCTMGTKVVERAVSLWNNQALVRTRRVRATFKEKLENAGVSVALRVPECTVEKAQCKCWGGVLYQIMGCSESGLGPGARESW